MNLSILSGCLVLIGMGGVICSILFLMIMDIRIQLKIERVNDIEEEILLRDKIKKLCSKIVSINKAIIYISGILFYVALFIRYFA